MAHIEGFMFVDVLNKNGFLQSRQDLALNR